MACMTLRKRFASIPVAFFSLYLANAMAAEPSARCMENSPERRGEIGCSIIAQKLLPEGLKEPVFWHIDRFDSIDKARAAAGTASVAFEADGKSWLMTVEAHTSDHHGGHHVAGVGPLPLPKASRYAMQVNSAILTPGMHTRIHTHSGVEGFYVVRGEQCLETSARATTMKKDQTLAIADDTPIRLVTTGTSTLYSLAIVVHDASLPSTTEIDDSTAPQLVACK